MKKSLIEEPTIDLLELFDQVGGDAILEKRMVPPTNKASYWWTRKPLIVGRAMALTSTLDNIDDVKLLLGLDRDKSGYLYTPNQDIYKKKLGRDPSEIKVLDPFGGSGNLVFPASELGLDVTCSDYNPIAYLIEKTILEYPAKYGVKLVEDFEKYAKQVIEKTEQEVDKFFKKDYVAYLWCWCIICPHCGQRIPLTNNSYIVKTNRNKIGIKFIPKDSDFTVELVHNISEKDGKQYTQKGGKAVCISCTNSISNDALTKDISERKDREMIVIQIKKNKIRHYIIPTFEDKKIYKNAKNYFNSKKDEFERLDLIPNEDIQHDPRSPLHKYGITKWNEYFDERQLLVLCTFLKNIKEICNQIKDKEYRKVITIYLTFMLTQRVNMAAFGVGWYSAREIPMIVLTFRRPGMVYNFSETNPFVQSSGGLYYILDNMIKAISFNTKLKNISKCYLESVTNTSDIKYDIILTDPPYGDDVQYGELSEFFYVWAYRALKDHYPELPSKILLDEDFCESWGRFGDKKLASEFFGKGLKQSFISMSQKLKDNGILVVFFANSNTKAWNLFLEAIYGAKFKVASSYSIHTENIGNVIARGKTSFMSSIIVTCRKLTEQKTAYFEDIIPQTEDNVKSMIDEIPAGKLLKIPITDLLIMVYGKVLETCTQFTELKSYEKDFKPDFETLIKGSQDFIMRELVSKLTGRNINLIGPEMAFYLLVRIFYRGKMAADDAIKITRAIMVDLNKLEKEGMITNVGGVTNLTPLQETNLELKPEELDSANLYQQLCYLATICQTKGASKVSAILSQSAGNIKADELKKIVPLLIKSYRLQINKNQKLDDSEQEELKILETISDTWGGTKIEDSLDGFI